VRDLLQTDFAAAMDVIIFPLLQVLNIAIDMYIWALIISAILSWLVAFNVVNTRNQLVYNIGHFLDRITEPALRPIRRILPSMGTVDLSPIVLILFCYFLQMVISQLTFRLMQSGF